MASISQRSNGTKLIQFSYRGKRQTIRLGKCNREDAEEHKEMIEAIIEFEQSKRPSLKMELVIAKYLEGLSDELYGRLAKTGLIQSKDEEQTPTLSDFIDVYIDGRSDVKPATKEIWRQGKLGLIRKFGADRELSAITAGDADDYVTTMRPNLKSYTIKKRIQFANALFRYAVRKSMIQQNPFESVTITVSMEDRRYFITRADLKILLENCPTDDWRLILVLARYGGLRCPSEVLSLRWEDVNWRKELVTVTSPKTERYEGHATREIPLFPELRDWLGKYKDSLGDRKYVVDEKFRKAANSPQGWKSCNLRTTFEKIIWRSGLKPWPKLFHNFRGSRVTELMDEFPVTVVAQWMGHSVAVLKALCPSDRGSPCESSWEASQVKSAALFYEGAAKSAAARPRIKQHGHLETCEKSALCGTERHPEA